MQEQKYTVKKLWLGRCKVAGGKPGWIGAGFAIVNQNDEITTGELCTDEPTDDYAINVFKVKYAAQSHCDWMNKNL